MKKIGRDVEKREGTSKFKLLAVRIINRKEAEF